MLLEPDNVLFFLIAFGAEVIGTLAGFGSSTVALPLTLFLFDFQTALTLVAFLHIFGNIGRLGFFRFGLDKSMLLRFGMPSVAFTVLGALLVNYIPQDVLKGVLGVFLVVYAVVSWSAAFRVRPNTATAVVGGGISGFFAGLIGTGGALRGAFLNTFELPKEKYVATAAAIALAVDITRLPVYLAGGFLREKFYWMLPVLFIIALLGSYAGKRAVSKIPQQTFRKVVLAAIFLVGMRLIYDWLV